MKRLLTLFAIVLMGCLVLCAQQESTLKVVTPRMSQKMYLTIKTNSNITQLMYHLLGASSMFEGELKIEAIAEHPNDAKKALNKLCAFLDDQGGVKYLEANLIQVFCFTARETQIAKSIYSDYKDEQMAIRERQELQKEKELISRWETYGKEVFEFSSKNENLIIPHIDLDVNKAIAYIDSITINPHKSSDNKIATINFIISDNGEIENFTTEGRCGNAFSTENFRPAEPAHYCFEHSDTTIFVPCEVNIPIYEEWKEIKEVEIEIKYNQKKKSWKISPYNPAEELTPDDLKIVNRFLEALSEDSPLRKKKNSLCIGIGKHWIEFKNKNLSTSFPISPQCRIIQHLDNKSSLQKFGEKHLNW